MRKRLVAGNWKMNGSRESIESLLSSILAGIPANETEVLVLVPFPYIGQVADQLKSSRIQWGAQNISDQDAGAYTGEVSGAMLRDFQCSHVLVGHSERRALYADTDELVAAKFVAAQRHGITPVLCVGETQQEREQGETLAVVERQLMAVVNKAGIEALGSAVLAYEPVWAIGTGLTASPEQAQEVHSALRAKIAALDTQIAQSISILYGGSVKAASAPSLFSCEDIDGGLIGGASLDPAEFLAICSVAD